MAKVNIGGQAVMEGVMMKNQDRYAVAVRKPDKEISIKVNEYTSVGERVNIYKLPILRGVVNFVESLVVGTKTLMYSAEFFEDEEDTSEKSKSKKNAEKKDDAGWMYGTVVVSILIAIGLFMLLPAWIAGLLNKIIDSSFLIGLIEGVTRLVIFLAYVIGISCLDDIKRTYMYHGAEHKTINCLEHGMDLTVENVMKSSRFHKRCGTSFLFIVMLVSILIFMCIKTDTMWLRLGLRVLLVPVIAGISYEFIKFAGNSESWIANFLSKPGLMIQRFTTKEPTEDMVEVAIASVEAIMDWRAYLEEQRQLGKRQTGKDKI